MMTARPTKKASRLLRARERALRTRCLSPAASAYLMVLPFFAAWPQGAGAQGVSPAGTTPLATPGLSEAGGLPGNGRWLFGVDASSSQSSNTPGLPFSEILRGNGTPFGYNL